MGLPPNTWALSQGKQSSCVGVARVCIRLQWAIVKQSTFSVSRNWLPSVWPRQPWLFTNQCLSVNLICFSYVIPHGFFVGSLAPLSARGGDGAELLLRGREFSQLADWGVPPPGCHQDKTRTRRAQTQHRQMTACSVQLPVSFSFFYRKKRLNEIKSLYYIRIKPIDHFGLIYLYSPCLGKIGRNNM